MEFRDGSPNTNYHPGPSYGRQGGSGVDLNRDFPAVGYQLKSHQPLSEPESRAFAEVLTDIRSKTTANRFAAAIDMHGMLTASAFSYTLLRISQDDYRKNAITVETSLRTWEDQTQRLRWSPYIGDSTGDGEQDRPAVIPVADEWGTVFDTLGYTVTGALGFWMDDSTIGLGAVGINNEMALSHLAPNSAYEASLVQTHIDGNKGLIYSQISALLLEEPVSFEPAGRVAYVHNPVRIQEEGWSRPQNPGPLRAGGGAGRDVEHMVMLTMGTGVGGGGLGQRIQHLMPPRPAVNSTLCTSRPTGMPLSGMQLPSLGSTFWPLSIVSPALSGCLPFSDSVLPWPDRT